MNAQHRRRSRSGPAATWRGNHRLSLLNLSLSGTNRLSQPPGEVLDVLPRDAARTRAAGDRPLARFGAELLGRDVEAVARGIAAHHRVIGLLIAGMEAEPEAEAVGERDLLLDRLAGVDRGRALILDHVARQEMPPVRCRVEHDVRGAPLDPALEHRLQRFVARVLLIEGEIVAEEDAAPLGLAQECQE